jgi:hypothetical protein
MPTSPSIAVVTGRVRTYINDLGNNGAGRVFTDTNPAVYQLLNSAVFQLQRDLENYGYKGATQEAIFYSVPPIYGVSGSGIPDPAAQQNMNFTGFFNGSQQIDAPALPQNLIIPLEAWERVSGSGNVFRLFRQSDQALVSATQGVGLGRWEWRNNAIYWNGSTQTIDVKLRFSCTNPVYTPDNADPGDFDSIFVPFIEDAQPIAAWMAYEFTRGRPLVDSSVFMEAYSQSMLGMADRIVKAKQSGPVSRNNFDEDESMNTSGWF